MAADDRTRDEIVDALDGMAGAPSGAARPAPVAPSPAQKPYSVTPPREKGPSRPAPEATQPRAEPPPASRKTEPTFHCLNCGYRLEAASDYRCSECGRAHDAATLERWFSGDEERRFVSVQWFVSAALLAKLFVFPQLMCVTRGAAALAVGAACYLAYREKRDSVGGYYAIAGVVTAAFLLAFAGYQSPLPYFTLDLIAGCLLMLSLLHDAEGLVLWESRGTRMLLLGVLFAVPILGSLLYWLDARAALPALPAPLDSYSLFGFVAPFLAALALWGYVWWTIRQIRTTIFPKNDAGAAA
jgi:hypothetical protein